MHYITYIVLMLASISSYAAKQNIFQGSWYSEGVVYSFINDSLYVDEIGNEGDIYTYKYKDGIITAISSLGDEFSFKIDKIFSDKIKIKFDGERPFVLDKVFNYDLDKMEFKNIKSCQDYIERIKEHNSKYKSNKEFYDRFIKELENVEF